ncbi:MAG: hypothetical protein JNG88_17310 [Phycisphaerales bacterium]|nr:hypothetical protein [Phycisphaerales bacterium]
MQTQLDDIRNSLVRSWGEMSGYWGINRTMAEIHALMFISTEPLCTDDVMEKLQISRGNASMNLRGLVDWGLIRRFHRLGDRKEYFQADTDVWHMFETIMRERRRREVEPIVATIDRCMETLRRIDEQRGGGDELSGAPRLESTMLAESRRRLENLRDFLATVGGLFDLVLRFGPQTMQQVAKMYSGMLQPPPGGAAGANRATEAVTNRRPAVSGATSRRASEGQRPRAKKTTRSRHERSRTR